MAEYKYIVLVDAANFEILTRNPALISALFLLYLTNPQTLTTNLFVAPCFYLQEKEAPRKRLWLNTRSQLVWSQTHTNWSVLSFARILIKRQHEKKHSALSKLNYKKSGCGALYLYSGFPKEVLRAGSGGISKVVNHSKRIASID